MGDTTKSKIAWSTLIISSCFIMAFILKYYDLGVKENCNRVFLSGYEVSSIDKPCR